MKIIHLSDVHGAHSFSEKEISNFLNKMKISIQKEGFDKCDFIVFSGDLANKGKKESFRKTEEIIEEIKNWFSPSKVPFLLVPGNHDLDLTDPAEMLKNYNNSVFKITGSEEQLFKKNGCLVLDVKDCQAILCNSSFHLDHSYGKIDLLSLKECLNSPSSKKYRIVVMHHHLISASNEASEIRNAYEVFLQLHRFKIDGIFHGHVHMHFYFQIGTSKIPIVGSGGLFSENARNICNQFNLIDLENKNFWTLKYSGDKVIAGDLGAFVKLEEINE